MMPEDEFLDWMKQIPDIATALRRLRHSQQLTLHEVADLAALSVTYIARLEHGERFPERDTLIALLLAAFSLPISQANRILLLAGYAPLHHKRLACHPY